jgi:thiosulfate/3-mercaptopyruvate sulfurtransferase
VEVTHEELARRLGEVALDDVRTEAEYAGTAGYRCDPRQGHIAGARHLELAELLGRTPDEVRALVGLPEGAEVVAYCHSGARSALAVEVLRAAGYEARNYAGSWHEWSRDAALPAETD